MRYNGNGIEPVLEVIRYLSFGSGDIEFPISTAEKDADICSVLTFNIANERV